MNLMGCSNRDGRLNQNMLELKRLIFLPRHTCLQQQQQQHQQHWWVPWLPSHPAYFVCLASTLPLTE